MSEKHPWNPWQTLKSNMANLKNLVDLVGSLEATFQHPAMPKLLHEARGCGQNHINPYQITHFHPMIGGFFGHSNHCDKMKIVTKSICGKRGSCSCSLSFFTWSKGVFLFISLKIRCFPWAKLNSINRYLPWSSKGPFSHALMIALSSTTSPCVSATFSLEMVLLKLRANGHCKAFSQLLTTVPRKHTFDKRRGGNGMRIYIYIISG